MPDILVEIGGRSYRVACAPGEEEPLRAAAGALDAEARAIQSAVGAAPESRMLLLAGLMVADRVAGADGKVRSAEEGRRAAEEARRAAEARAAEAEARLREAEARAAAAGERADPRAEPSAEPRREARAAAMPAPAAQASFFADPEGERALDLLARLAERLEALADRAEGARA